MKLPCLNQKQKECIKHAKGLIEKKHSICIELCTELNQQFENVKHMTWFHIAVANHLIETTKKWQNCELIVIDD
jgi:hypothetical protein